MSDDCDYDEDTDVGAYQSMLCASRAEKSLGLLSQRFIELLQDAPDGTIDLNRVRGLN